MSSVRNTFSPAPISTSRPKRSGVRAATRSRSCAPSEKPIASTSPSGSAASIDASRCAYVGGIVGRVGGAVPEQVDRDHRPVGVAQEVDPSRRPPAVLERRAESVHEHDGLIPHRDSVRANRERPPSEVPGAAALMFGCGPYPAWSQRLRGEKPPGHESIGRPGPAFTPAAQL